MKELLAISTLAALVACSPQIPSAPAAPPAAPPAAALVTQPPLPPITKEQWQKAFATAFTKHKAEKDEDGVTTFAACFEGTQPHCKLIALGKRDAFRKLTIFEPAGSRMRRFGGGEYLHSYVSVLDCEAPSIMLNPRFFSKGSWIFLARVAVMAHDEVVLDHSIEHGDVDRDNQSWGVTEASTWIASEDDIKALRKIATAGHLVVRLTGKKGFTTIAKTDISTFKQDAREITAIFDRLTIATKDKMPKTCS